MKSNKKSKLTLIIDGNWLLMSRLYVINNKYEQNEELVKSMKILMLQSINLVLKTFPDIDNVIFVSDGGSWRNKLDIPVFIDQEYKGQREPNPDIDWDLIFSGYEELRNELNQYGITTCWESGIEGDDWCWYWSKELNKDGTNVIIWSKDKDLTQLVNIDSNKCFTICWNKEGGVICADYEEDDMDFLFNPHFAKNEELLNNIILHSKGITKINPKHVVIDKIIRGDAGDNILPIITKKSASSDKVFRVAQKDIDDTIDFLNDYEIVNYITELLDSKSYKGKVDKPLNDILEHFRYNTKLVYLDESSYPKDLLSTMKTYDEYNCSNNILDCLNYIKAEKNQLNSILEEI